ncbi:PREDICTED: LYR motif-containing protein 9-like [Priapulus caudatus]|uniref:LYR motif-containing protein 9 n=1 Tax=Priapulus caudatus TaxID=37621 RepID=A0ABM1EJN9_PRICU|nr:PREDICTED: LYR motif-containing protein 9-like [Priapulus caudatus]
MPAGTAVNTVVRSPVSLYRHLLRQLRQLPDHAGAHYRHQLRQQFNSHKYEIDKDRILQISRRALEDVQWITNKYGKKSE